MIRVPRFVYAALGLVFVALGVIGTFLPVLPTTPFLLISLWAFSKSSRRLEHWLLHHPRFGPRLRAWRQHRAIPWSVKLTAWTSMLVSLTIMLLVGTKLWAVASAATLMLYGAIFVARSATAPPAPPATAPPGADTDR